MFSRGPLRATVKLTWTPPRGEFHKYSVRIIHLGPSPNFLTAASRAIRKQSTIVSVLSGFLCRSASMKLPDEVWLPRDSVEHIADGLLPGERYQVEVKSMTDKQKNMKEKTPTEIFLTHPVPPSRVKIVEACDQVSTKASKKNSQAEVSWSPPEGEGNSNLVGFKIRLK